MRILVVDNNMDRDWWGARDLVRQAIEQGAPGATVFVRRGPHEDLPRDLSGFDRVVISGSRQLITENPAWGEGLEGTIRRILDLGRPLLGVCYGHQAIARALGGRRLLRMAKVPEKGWKEIRRVGHAPLFEGMPETFHSYQNHVEEVSELPPGTRLLARNDACDIQAYVLEGRPVYGVQFHPEKIEPSEKRFDPEISRTLFRNFFTL